MLKEPPVAYFARHCVLLSWIDQTPETKYGTANLGLGAHFTISGFMISVRNHWFMVTAGHVLDDIAKARERGQILTNFTLDDTLGVGAKFTDHSVPFVDFDKCWKRHVDEDGLDFGVIAISPYTGRQLQTQPVAEDYWKNLPAEIDEFYLLGAPGEFQDIDTINGLHFQHRLCQFRVEPVRSPPASFLTRWERMFYRIPQDLTCKNGERLEDIDGMSGGPLIGINLKRIGPDGYYFLGIQSGWNRESRLAWATPLKRIGEWLETGILALGQEQRW